ncbi:Uroporphyrinogen decarboxylase [Candidatus Desulfosporosinus infrequens]|uniref:Uroporphyrinogen decarboxylase n=1 Tax=Candidatus Desulfosporosinus infrequens TaxID=2043169 RepID=A0A2U3K969_9FIRM|nr:Uroporphyrinogen decarboxylase [Candidatus Desulfosporosinus infrequens]
MSDGVKSDQMTPKERMTAFVAGKEIDRIPCMPLIGDHACRLIGVSVARYSHSAKLMAEGQIAVFRLYRPDGAGVGPGLFGIAEAMGTKLEFPENGTPYVDEPVLKDWSDFSTLAPVDPYQDGRLPLFLETLQMINEQIGDQVGVGSSVGGPFTAAASLRGTENFLKDLLRNPEMAHALLQLVTESALRYIDAVCDLGFKPSISEPTASGTLISAKQFQEFAKPYLKMYADRIIERCGSGPMLHICGNTNRIWPDMVDIGATVLSLDNIVDLAEAKEAVGHRACLAGNVKPVDTLMKGNREQIYAEAKECLRKTYDSPKGYILSSGCALALDTPRENVIALMDAARIYGSYPIDPEKLV